MKRLFVITASMLLVLSGCDSKTEEIEVSTEAVLQTEEVEQEEVETVEEEVDVDDRKEEGKKIEASNKQAVLDRCSPAVIDMIDNATSDETYKVANYISVEDAFVFPGDGVCIAQKLYTIIFIGQDGVDDFTMEFATNMAGTEVVEIRHKLHDDDFGLMDSLGLPLNEDANMEIQMDNQDVLTQTMMNEFGSVDTVSTVLATDSILSMVPNLTNDYVEPVAYSITYEYKYNDYLTLASRVKVERTDTSGNLVEQYVENSYMSEGFGNLILNNREVATLMPVDVVNGLIESAVRTDGKDSVIELNEQLYVIESDVTDVDSNGYVEVKCYDLSQELFELMEKDSK